jgi:ribosomal protein L22
VEKQYSPGKKENNLRRKEEKLGKKEIEAVKESPQDIEEKKTEVKTEKQAPNIVLPKAYAKVKGNSLAISPKNSKYICKMINKKEVDLAIKMLEEVVVKKRVVKMNGAEIPHRKGKGMMSGRYPVNAAKEFLILLKQLRANANVNGIGIPIISLAVSNKASLPYRKEGRRGKRTNVFIEARDKTKISGGNK